MADTDENEQKMTVDKWKESWSSPDVDFHNPDLNAMFLKYNNKMLTKPGMRIFVPLCGKAVEMKWLLDHGYKVVGLEVAPVPCKAFFEENNIPYQVKEIGAIPGEKYESLDGKCAIFCCDFFQISADICGEFEGIWDSGGLNAMEIEDRAKYINIVRALMGKGCVNMTEFNNFDFDTNWSMSTTDLEKCFGEGYQVENVAKMDAPPKMKDIGCISLLLFTITRT